MNEPDLVQQIITSQEAATFLRMVTKGFYSDSYIGLWIFEVIGREWDEMREWAEGLKDEIFPQTCTWTIAIWEWLYGIEPDESLSLEFRRQRILAKICALRPINPEVIRRGVAALIGTDPEGVEVNDFVGPYRFEVILHPGENPFPYNRIDQYIWEIKPSHLAFDTLVETKVVINVLIDTKWDLYGYGMTGLYNAGTRPDINIKGQLYDIIVDAETAAKGAGITTEVTGTVYATAPGTDTQRMQVPSTAFVQDRVIVDAETAGAGFRTEAPPASEEGNETGRYPSPHIIGHAEKADIIAHTGGKAADIPQIPAGTVPDIRYRFSQDSAEIRAETASSGSAYTTDQAGTKPQAAHAARLENAEIRAETNGAGYRNTHTPVSDSGRTGTQPGIHTAAATAKDKGGIVPEIRTDSHPVNYPMCGTRTTKRS